MLRKLYALVSHSCCIDNPDSPQHQEVLLPGALYGMIIKEKLEEALNNFRRSIAIDIERSEPSVDFYDSKLVDVFGNLALTTVFRAIHQENALSDEL